MKTIVKIIYVLFSAIFIFYLSLPNPKFPQPPSDALQSLEPADTETPLRRAYFTNYTREEVLKHYLEQLQKSSFLNISLPTYRLNYPPEEAQTLIRDQTRSTFLEEIVHPFRESLFVNGFEPKVEKDAIYIEGKVWRQKIIVRFVPSKTFTRVIIGLLTTCLVFVVSKNTLTSVLDLIKIFRKKWI